MIDGAAARLKTQGRVLWSLFERESRSRFFRSPTGVFSELIEPMAFICFLTLIFSSTGVKGDHSLGEYMMLFFATGYLPLHCFKRGAMQAKRMLKQNRRAMCISLIKPLDLLAVGGFICTIIFTFLILIFTFFFMLFYDMDWPQNLIFALAPFFINGAMGIGVGAFNASVETVWPVWERIFMLATAPLVLVSGVFYTAAFIPEPAWKYLYWNPFMHSSEFVRNFYFREYTSEFLDIPFYLMCAGLFIVLGLATERLFRPRLIEQIE